MPAAGVYSLGPPCRRLFCGFHGMHSVCHQSPWPLHCLRACGVALLVRLLWISTLTTLVLHPLMGSKLQLPPAGTYVRAAVGIFSWQAVRHAAADS